jgi:hypothetical protein
MHGTVEKMTSTASESVNADESKSFEQPQIQQPVKQQPVKQQTLPFDSDEQKQQVEHRMQGESLDKTPGGTNERDLAAPERQTDKQIETKQAEAAPAEPKAASNTEHQSSVNRSAAQASEQPAAPSATSHKPLNSEADTTDKRSNMRNDLSPGDSNDLSGDLSKKNADDQTDVLSDRETRISKP